MILLFTLMSIIGATCVSGGKALTANYIWSVSNLGLLFYNLSIVEYEMAFLFGVYEFISLCGIYNLKLRKHAPIPDVS